MKGSIGRQTKYHSLFYRVKGYNKNVMKILRSIYISSKEDIISFRLKVLNFHSLYGTRETIQAYGISKATIYRWKKRWEESGFEAEALMDKSKVPKKRRKREVHKEVEEFIISYREEHPGVGKETIKYALDNFCDFKGIKKISISTIGRIIKDLKEKGKIMDRKKKLSLDARTGKLYERRKRKYRKKLRLKRYEPKNAGELVQMDSISIFKNGIKRYIITAVDVFTRFSFAYVYKNLSSLSARDFIEKFKSVAPFEIKSIQTDNGKEFEKYFRKYLEQQNLPHYFTYPKHPQNNSFVERFNRTLKEQWLFFYDDEILCPQSPNKYLINYLLWFNTQKPHKNLNGLPPLKFFLK